MRGTVWYYFLLRQHAQYVTILLTVAVRHTAQVKGVSRTDRLYRTGWWSDHTSNTVHSTLYGQPCFVGPTQRSHSILTEPSLQMKTVDKSDSTDGNGDWFLTDYNDSMIGYEKIRVLTSLVTKYKKAIEWPAWVMHSYLLILVTDADGSSVSIAIIARVRPIARWSPIPITW